MKKIIVLLFAFSLFTAIPAAAQFSYGLKAGANLAQKPSTEINELKENLKGGTGWFVGPNVKYVISAIGLGVEADVLYSQTKLEVAGQSIMSQSIDIPLYLRFEISLPLVKKFLEPFIAVGPQFGWNIGDKEITLDYLKNEDYSKYTLNNSDISFNIGAGVTMFKHLQVHCNYNLALGKTAEIKNFDATEVMELKTSKWQLSLAYIF